MENLLESKLLDIGLTKKEIKIYLALLELGETTIARIADKSTVKRTTTYLAIDSLKEKGLVSELKKKKKNYFYAEDPRKLQGRINERKMAIDDAIPQLLAIANFIDKKPKVTFYEGVEGIKDIFRDTLNYPNKEMLAWVPKTAFDILGKEFTGYYMQERIKKAQMARVIAPNNQTMQAYRDDDEKSLRKTRLIDEERYPLAIEINLYGDKKTGIMSFEERMGLIIESPKIFVTLKSIFEMHWDILP